MNDRETAGETLRKRLQDAYYATVPDLGSPGHSVAFGTSGHRGSALSGSFTETHIIAICKAIAEHRKTLRATGPLFLGMDTHALSLPAFRTAVEVFAANDVDVMIQEGEGFTPTPVISRAILVYNRGKKSGFADGVVVTPSHNPPEDGGFKYNPPEGGPASPESTTWIQNRANELIAGGIGTVARIPYERAYASGRVHAMDYVLPYVRDLGNIIDMKAIRDAKIRIGVDPMGGSNVAFWDPIASEYGLTLDVVNRTVDPSFSFMPPDRDGKIRMDCSSPWAMKKLCAMKDSFDISFGTDPDSDRHGIVTAGGGLMQPNAFLAAAVDYLFGHRPGWGKSAGVGKTAVSSAMIDRVAAGLGRPLFETPVGFKWFVQGLLDGSLGFGGEESAGASFLRDDGTVWTTDKDGIILGLCAAEILAVTGKAPDVLYGDLEKRYGATLYERIDVPATGEQKARIKRLAADPSLVGKGTATAPEAVLTNAPGNAAPLGGIKVVFGDGWFAVRPSGTEDIIKLYSESFSGETSLRRLQGEAFGLLGIER